FTKETETEDEELEGAEPLPAGVKNYITPAGLQRLREEFRHLKHGERPKVVELVSWAAGNGDRSENGDYLYGKKRLREIDRRVRFLIKRLENAEVVLSAGRDTDQVFFGATVALRSAAHGERTVTIVGADEAEPSRGRVSWHSPIARALLKAREGDSVLLRSPAGDEELEILEVRYDPVD
ncbi:MAG: transcription elongation factor GreB, partial [Proteobacteria bacterium]|nr:transcription elongation factor GreB [Pseudomonadota bacterium]